MTEQATPTLPFERQATTTTVDDAMVARTTGVLMALARNRQTITYTNLAELLGLKLDWQSRRAYLGRLLDAVADFSYREWRVVLPALVVGQRSNMPSGDPSKPSGFWAWLTHNGFDFEECEAELLLKLQGKAFVFFGA